MGGKWFFLFAATASMVLGCSVAEARQTETVVSPNGQLRVEFSLADFESQANVPQYRVIYRDRVLLANAPLGINFHDGNRLGGSCEIVRVDRDQINDSFTQISGKQREINTQAVQLTVRLREASDQRRTWGIQFRVFDDGAAFRYLLEKQSGWEDVNITGERTQFRIPKDATVVSLPLGNFNTSYEGSYQTSLANQISTAQLLGLPILIQTVDGTSLALTEANVYEYAGMFMVHRGDGVLEPRLAPLPSEKEIAVRHTLPHVSPWRVMMIGDRIGTLVESNIVLALNEPCAIEDPSWIQTGKTTFPWWNGYYEKGVDFRPGLNTETMKYYIDFCSESGIPYHSLDGVKNIAWYGGPIVPYEGADPTTAIDGLDFAETIRYAQSKGVRLRLWMHWKAAEMHMERAFPLYGQLGIEGVMLDFMDRDDQEMNRFVRRAVALAAENKLTITLHGCPKPTGLERTYPNLLTHEGVKNLEYDKWDETGITPEHELTVPFTRMLAGPLDFHQGSLRTVAASEYRPRDSAPLVIGTPARTLAGYVVFQNHLSMVADFPSAYRGHPALPILAAIPTTWDETRVLTTSVGEFTAIARRNGSQWHLGAMTNHRSRTLDVPLTFLPHGQFEAQIAIDESEQEAGLALRREIVTAATVMDLSLAAAGGAYIRFVPVDR
jgi:alpha-glucosidase